MRLCGFNFQSSVWPLRFFPSAEQSTSVPCAAELQVKATARTATQGLAAIAGPYCGGRIRLDRMKNRLSFWIYLVGILPLAIWAPSARALLGDWTSFAAVIAYLLLLRLGGAFATCWLELRKYKAIEQHNRRVESRRTKSRRENGSGAKS